MAKIGGVFKDRGGMGKIYPPPFKKIGFSSEPAFCSYFSLSPGICFDVGLFSATGEAPLYVINLTNVSCKID